MYMDDEQDRQLMERDLDQPDYFLEGLLHKYSELDSDDEDSGDDGDLDVEDLDATLEAAAQQLAKRHNLNSAEVKAALLRKLEKNTPEDLSAFNADMDNLVASDDDYDSDSEEEQEEHMSFGSADLDDLATSTYDPRYDAVLRTDLDSLSAEELQELRQEVEMELEREAQQQIKSREEACKFNFPFPYQYYTVYYYYMVLC